MNTFLRTHLRISLLVSAIALVAVCTCFAEPVKKVIFIGDSITQHSPSVEKLGWHGDYGMAATSEGNDYVHQFIALLTDAQGEAPEVEVYARGGGRLPGQLKFLDAFKQSGAQVAIVQMGENDKLQGDGASFLRDYERILQAIRSGNPDCRIFCFSVWAPPTGNQKKDSMIREACEKYDATFVSLKSVIADPRNQAHSEGNFTHPGVNWHPGDRGMAQIAKTLWAVYNGESQHGDDLNYQPVQWSHTVDWYADTAAQWHPEVTIIDDTAVLQQEAAGHVQYRLQLPTEKIKGSNFLLKTRIKADHISEKPKPWNGIKLMLRLQNAEGVMEYPQQRLPAGSYDWKDIAWNLIIPDNIVSAELVIGLENVTGTAYVDPIEISVRSLK